MRQQGFTLIELIITVTIVAIVLGFAMPSFETLIKNTRIKTETAAMTDMMAYARSEAIKLGRWVTVCARETDTTCGSNWKNGWLLFLDSTTATNIEGNGVIEPDTDTVLMVHTELPTKVVTSASGFNKSNYIRFTPNGNVTDITEPTWIKVCDNRVGKHGRIIRIRPFGRPHTDTANCT